MRIYILDISNDSVDFLTDINSNHRYPLREIGGEYFWKFFVERNENSGGRSKESGKERLLNCYIKIFVIIKYPFTTFCYLVINDVMIFQTDCSISPTCFQRIFHSRKKGGKHPFFQSI